MKHKILLAAVMLAVGIPSVQAQETAALDIKPRSRIVTSDGVKLGVDRVVKATDGSVLGAQVIYDGQFVTVPASTLTSSDAGLVTSLTRKDLRKLKK